MVGAHDGMVQIFRLIILLASLSILLSMLSLTQIVAGLNTLVMPFSFLGSLRERMVIRLALTMHYAENSIVQTSGSWRNSIETMLYAVPVTPDSIDIEIYKFSRYDWLFIVLATVVVSGTSL